MALFLPCVVHDFLGIRSEHLHRLSVRVNVLLLLPLLCNDDKRVCELRSTAAEATTSNLKNTGVQTLCQRLKLRLLRLDCLLPALQ